MTQNKEKALLNGQMEENILDLGLKVNSTERAFTFQPKTSNVKEHGSMESALNGRITLELFRINNCIIVKLSIIIKSLGQKSQDAHRLRSL